MYDMKFNLKHVYIGQDMTTRSDENRFAYLLEPIRYVTQPKYGSQL